MTETLLRLLAASATVCAYAALCAAIFRRERRHRAQMAQATAALAGDGATPSTLVVFATQTGQAEAIAWQTARQLHADGTPARVISLNDLDAALLGASQRALFIVSTYGEGDAPDGASVFAERCMDTAAAPPSLPALHYAVLALGDAQYTQFCGFGRALDAWLARTGATPLFERIEVDNSDPVTLAAWHAHWGGEAPQDPSAENTDFTPWRLTQRLRMNEGSVGAPVFHLALVPQNSAHPPPTWMSGDLVQIAVASDPQRPRDYSIASIASDGEVQLLVRQERHPDGTLGAASGLLTSMLSLGDSVALRIRPHRNFQLGDNAARPLILIGNGTGLAGLRSHLRARVAAGQHDNWLLFGERNAAHDFLCRDELTAWQATGALKRLDMVFSRDQSDRLYVQHRLLQVEDVLRAWLDRGAAIYVCGSLQGMASGVDAALRQIAGDAALRELTTSGRYRRDVY